MSAHPTDPAAAFRAADELGRLVAQHLLAQEDAAAALEQAAASARNPRGCRVRLAWRLADATSATATARRHAVRAIGDALAPLLAARAPRTALEAAASAADPQGVLTPAERAATVRAAVLAALRGRS